MTALRKRDRIAIGGGLLLVALLAWAWLWYDARRMNAGSACCTVANLHASAAAALPPLIMMWAVMMLAMMLPSALPMVLTFAAVGRSRQRAGRNYVPIAVFVAGYVVVWSAFSVVAAVAQWWLHRGALLSAAMVSTSGVLAGLVLIVAGIFQFTPLKHSCLNHCRGTLHFVITRWRDGAAGALRMGIEHGAFCAGCCWALMALLFVLGVMNLFWVAALTALVCFEKILPAQFRLPLVTGMVMVGAGAYLLGGGASF